MQRLARTASSTHCDARGDDDDGALCSAQPCDRLTQDAADFGDSPDTDAGASDAPAMSDASDANVPAPDNTPAVPNAPDAPYAFAPDANLPAADAGADDAPPVTSDTPDSTPALPAPDAPGADTAPDFSDTPPAADDTPTPDFPDLPPSAGYPPPYTPYTPAYAPAPQAYIPIAPFNQTWTATQGAATINTSQTITVTGTVLLTGVILVTGGATVTVTGSGTLLRDPGFVDTMLDVLNGSTLILEDITIDGNRDNVSAGNPAIFVGGNSTLEMHDGAILQNAHNNNATGGIMVSGSNAVFNMYGGTVRNNSEPFDEGGVFFFTGAVFNMHGGVIYGNTTGPSTGTGTPSNIGDPGAATANITGGILAPDGAGTSASPWLIANVANWNWMRDNHALAAGTNQMPASSPAPAARYYTLAANLDLRGTAGAVNNDAMIGGLAVTPATFSGNFNGGGNTVQVNINADLDNGVGLFRRNEGNIANLTVTGSVTNLTGNYTGALVGHNAGGTVTNSRSAADVSGNNHTGGLVGANTGTIQNSSASGFVTGTGTGGHNIGGLVGLHGGSGIIRRSFATGNVNASANSVGGLVGLTSGTATIEDSFATGNVTGNLSAGGLVGSHGVAIGAVNTITRSYATGTVSGTGNAGGITGNSHTNIQNSVALSGNISVTPATVTTVGRIWGGGTGSVGGAGNFAHPYTLGCVVKSEMI
ncbi:MAG: hypothetical protein FWC70_12070 [Defluviitaleaceae bacterium]|nr:hypothetical protein [Defluviitaleaceae bacterium]